MATATEGRNLSVPRPNSVKDPVRLYTSVERDIADSLREFAARDDRPLSVYLRVVLTKFVQQERAAGEEEPVPEPAEARYSS